MTMTMQLRTMTQEQMGFNVEGRRAKEQIIGHVIRHVEHMHHADKRNKTQ